MQDLEPYREVSSMPPVVRDISVVVDKNLDIELLGDMVRDSDVDEKLIEDWCKRPDFVDYKIYISKLSRLKPYILSEKEERILSLEAESATACQKSFSMLTNVDIDYGTIKTKNGKMPLTQTTWSSFMENPDREIRKSAYNKFYDAFDNHKNTIASLYTGSVQHDIFEAKARGYKSAREMALFPDKVPETVYDNLVSTVRENLAPLHKYYSLRKEILGLKDLRHYDVYVPLVKDVKQITPYNDAVAILKHALSPLGEDYTSILCDGLQNGWVDRYETKVNEVVLFRQELTQVILTFF
jgi:oligoendopeptidase F